MTWPTALPVLRGRWLDAFRILWTLLLVLAVIGATGGMWARYRATLQKELAFADVGLRSDIASRRVTVSPLDPQPQRAGIVPKSTIVAIDGRSVSDSGDRRNMTQLARALKAPDGAELRLTLRAPDGGMSLHQVTSSPRHLADADRASPLPLRTQIAFDAAVDFLITVMAMTTAVLLFRRRAHDPVVALLAVAGLTFNISTLAWLFPHLGLGPPLNWLRIAGYAAVILAMAVFPAGRFEPRWSLLILPLLAVYVLTPLWPQSLSGWWLDFNSFVLIVALAMSVQRYRLLPAGRQRQQIKWAVLGFACFVLFTAAQAAIVQVDRNTTDNSLHVTFLILSSLTNLIGTGGLLGGFLLSLLHYRLYDADAAIGRSAAYATLTLSLLAVFAGSEKLIEVLGEAYFGRSAGKAAGVIAASLAAALLVPLHGRLTKWAESRFQGDLVRLRRDLPLLMGDLRETAALHELTEATLRALVTGVRAQRAALLVPEGDGFTAAALHDVSPEHLGAWMDRWRPAEEVSALDCDRNDQTFPVRIPLGHAGWIALGPRQDGSFYAKDARELLLGLANPIARAVAVVRRRDAREAEAVRERLSVRDRLAAMEAALGLAGGDWPVAAGLRDPR